MTAAPPDRALDLASGPESLSRQQKVFTMVGALLGLLLAALDQTIVSTAGPRIQHDLHIEASLYVWITTAYIVASTVLVPIYGKASDLYGRRRVLLISIVIFLTGSLLCGISQSSSQLIAFRAVQGVGSAGLFTSAFAVVADLFPPAERGKYQGIFGAAFGLSSVVGPLLGGFITDQFGWHWAFFINLPLGVIAIALIIARMPALKRTHDARPKLDVAGAVALTTAALPLLLALSLGRAAGVVDRGGWPWASWQILALVATSVVGVISFIAIERRASSPILDLKLFENTTFRAGSIATFVVGGAFLGAIVFLPLFMVNVVGLSATSSGLTTVPLTFGIVVANIASGQLVSRFGSYKRLLLGSLVVLVGSLLLLALTLDPDATQASVSVKMIFLGIGLGPGIPLFTLAIQNAVPPHQIGVATAAATFFRQMGMTVGIAIAGTVFATSLSHALHDQIAEATRDVPPAMRAQFAPGHHTGNRDDEAGNQVAFDAAAIKLEIADKLAHVPMPPDAVAGMKQRAFETVDKVARAFKVAFTDSLIDVFWLLLVIAVAGLLATLFLPQLPLRKAAIGAPRAPPE